MCPKRCMTCPKRCMGVPRRKNTLRSQGRLFGTFGFGAGLKGQLGFKPNGVPFLLNLGAAYLSLDPGPATYQLHDLRKLFQLLGNQVPHP